MKLGELIEDRKRALGMSYGAMSDKARDQGFTLSRQTLSEFATEELAEAPRRRTMEALAVALDVGYPEVVMAVAESLIGGSAAVEARNSQGVFSLVTLLGGRSDEDVASVLRVVRTVTDALDVRDRSGANGAGADRHTAEASPPNGGGVSPDL